MSGHRDGSIAQPGQSGTKGRGELARRQAGQKSADDHNAGGDVNPKAIGPTREASRTSVLRLADDQGDDAGRRPSSAELLARLKELLTPHELELLVAVLFDGAEGAELAEVYHVHQTTISYRVRKALAKLAAAGIRPVAGVGQPAAPKCRVAFADPAAMDRLTVVGHTPAGRAVARWEPNHHPLDRQQPQDRPLGNRARNRFEPIDREPADTIGDEAATQRRRHRSTKAAASSAESPATPPPRPPRRPRRPLIINAAEPARPDAIAADRLAA